MQFDITEEGFVHQCTPGSAGAVAAGPRLAVTDAGDVVCSFMVQSALGINDFVPMCARSSDRGRTWSAAAPIWPELIGVQSLFCSVSRSPAGDLFLFGKRWTIDEPGESFWCDATQGMKQNELFWARSEDGGHTWTAPQPIAMPIAGSAEAPGAMQVLRNGRWIAPYAPYNTFDPDLVVDRNQVVLMYSDDEGNTWQHASMFRFDSTQSTGAEAWAVELADGRILGTGWHINQGDGGDFPNAYALSLDGGVNWSLTLSTGILGQATALTALPDGRALFVYNQRQHGEVGGVDRCDSPDDGRFWRRDESDSVARRDHFTERHAWGSQRVDRLRVWRATRSQVSRWELLAGIVERAGVGYRHTLCQVACHRELRRIARVCATHSCSGM